MNMTAERVFLDDIVRTFRKTKALADGALAQVAAGDLHRAIDSDANSLAVLMLHVSGNLRSRFTDFLTSDGEKPDRDRDREFVAAGWTADALFARWQEGWEVALETIEALTPEDLTRTVYIRAEAFLVIEALNRAATHTAYHAGQIVLLARHFAGVGWRTLTIPRGQSAQAVGSYKQDAERV
jgi:Protein of unknown function (DUF1572)